MNKTSLFLLLATVMLSSLFQSCGIGKNDYSEFQRLPDSGWLYEDSLSFVPCIEDSVSIGRLIVAVHHNNDYAYSNLWLEVTHLDQSGDIVRDTINMRLCDNYGRWQGHGFGAEYQFADTVPGMVRIVNDSSIIVRHVMRVDNLADIEQIGVTFVSSER